MDLRVVCVAVARVCRTENLASRCQQCGYKRQPQYLRGEIRFKWEFYSIKMPEIYYKVDRAKLMESCWCPWFGKYSALTYSLILGCIFRIRHLTVIHDLRIHVFNHYLRLWNFKNFYELRVEPSVFCFQISRSRRAQNVTFCSLFKQQTVSFPIQNLLYYNKRSVKGLLVCFVCEAEMITWGFDKYVPYCVALNFCGFYLIFAIFAVFCAICQKKECSRKTKNISAKVHFALMRRILLRKGKRQQ